MSSTRPGTGGRPSWLYDGRPGSLDWPETRHVPDHRDRPDGVVVALQPPGRDRGIVGGPIQGEVELDVPLETIHRRTGSPDPGVRGELVGDGVGDDIPVSGRRLGLRAVGPELGERAGEVSQVDHVRIVRLARHRIGRMPVAVVGPKRVGAERAGRDVDRGNGRRVELTAVADHLDRLVLVGLVGQGVTEARWGAWIHRHARDAPIGQGEPLDAAPVRPDGPLDAILDRNPVLGDHVLELQRLPSVGVGHRDPRLRDDERRIDRLVVGGAVAPGLVRPVGHAIGDDRLAIRLPSAAGASPSVVVTSSG